MGLPTCSIYNKTAHTAISIRGPDAAIVGVHHIQLTLLLPRVVNVKHGAHTQLWTVTHVLQIIIQHKALRKPNVHWLASVVLLWQ